MNKLFSVGILLIIVYVVYTYINKKSSQCYHCEIRKDKLLRTFMLKSKCRQKFESSNGTIYTQVWSSPPITTNITTFEEFAQKGGCLEPITNGLNLPIGAQS